MREQRGPAMLRVPVMAGGAPGGERPQLVPVAEERPSDAAETLSKSPTGRSGTQVTVLFQCH